MGPRAREGRYDLCIVGVGNTLAGDDGAGNVAAARLREMHGDRGDVFIHSLETDPLELWELLPLSGRFIFLDAVAGRPSGMLVELGRNSALRAYPASLHHMDLPTVVGHLSELRGLNDLEWSIWGVTIEMPEILGEGLSPEVSRAVEEMVGILSRRIDARDHSVKAPPVFARMDRIE
ncbi:MAG: hypothetical protein AVO35_04800 [Candidatus Aegiribacteria sp. MLS_C]|nr:MAG: hypothetical protein AVO35_04800 [Candidatus Aegiribacteria sp. MLS_C]